jgi:hypothetical protein
VRQPALGYKSPPSAALFPSVLRLFNKIYAMQRGNLPVNSVPLWRQKIVRLIILIVRRKLA